MTAMSENGAEVEDNATEKKSISSEERSSRAQSIVGGDDIDIDANVQYAGILKKPPFGTRSYGMLTRWTERFCVVKESFLLYYDKSEKKAYETKKMFNIHPKGVIPLAGCTIENFDDIGKPCLKITHASFKTRTGVSDNEGTPPEMANTAKRHSISIRARSSSRPKGLDTFNGGNLVLAARNPEERDNWVNILRECSKVTWNNAQLGAAQIKLLEENTAKINKEKKEYIEKLQAEAELRRHEEGKTEELERLAKQLEEEKGKMEDIANKFKEEKEMTHQELLDAMNAMKSLDEEREKMDSERNQLEVNLKKMEEEKRAAADLLKEREVEAAKLADDKSQLEATKTSLKSHLESLEMAAKNLEEEKRRTEERLAENEIKAAGFAEECKKLERTATEAQLTAQEIAAKKEEYEKKLDMTETTLEIEKIERKKLEKRLRLAEDSLRRLDRALKDSGLKVSLEIEADVTTLKSFFEDAAAEAELQAKKHLLMEQAVKAKKSYEQKAYTGFKTKSDMYEARESMNKIDVDPRLLGESQTTESNPHTPDIPEAADQPKDKKVTKKSTNESPGVDDQISPDVNVEISSEEKNEAKEAEGDGPKVEVSTTDMAEADNEPLTPPDTPPSSAEPEVISDAPTQIEEEEKEVTPESPKLDETNATDNATEIVKADDESRTVETVELGS